MARTNPFSTFGHEITTPSGNPPVFSNSGRAQCHDLAGWGSTHGFDPWSQGMEPGGPIWVEVQCDPFFSGDGTGMGGTTPNPGGPKTGGGAGHQSNTNTGDPVNGNGFTETQQKMVNKSVVSAKGILKNIKKILSKIQQTCGNANGDSNFDKLLDCLENIGNGATNIPIRYGNLQPGNGKPCPIPPGCLNNNADAYTDTSSLPHHTYIDMDKLAGGNKTPNQLDLDFTVLHELIHSCSFGGGLSTMGSPPPLDELDVQIMTTLLGVTSNPDKNMFPAGGIYYGNYFSYDPSKPPGSQISCY